MMVRRMDCTDITLALRRPGSLEKAKPQGTRSPRSGETGEGLQALPANRPAECRGENIAIGAHSRGAAHGSFFNLRAPIILQDQTTVQARLTPLLVPRDLEPGGPGRQFWPARSRLPQQQEGSGRSCFQVELVTAPL